MLCIAPGPSISANVTAELGSISTHGTLTQLNYRQIFEDIYKESLLKRPLSEHFHSAKNTEILYGLYNEENTFIKNHQEAITNEYLINALKYIQGNLAMPFSVKTMSKDLSLSQRYIYSLFKKELGTTPVSYINESRINYSKNLLTTSNLPIHEVALLSGYDNSTYFITLFRKNSGVTPLQFRNKSNNNL